MHCAGSRQRARKRLSLFAVSLQCTVLAFLLLFVGSGLKAGTSDGRSDSITVYLVGYGYHVGLFLPARAIPDSLIPERGDFPEAVYLEFGWGDADFYRAPRFNLLLGLKALFLPTRSVLHVAGWPEDVPRYFPGRPVIALRFSETEFLKLVRFVHRSFRRTRNRRVRPVSRGLYRTSFFYPATGTYSALYTCNTWTAKALAAAGCPLHARSIVSAGALLRAAARCAEYRSRREKAKMGR